MTIAEAYQRRHELAAIYYNGVAIRFLEGVPQGAMLFGSAIYQVLTGAEVLYLPARTEVTTE